MNILILGGGTMQLPAARIARKKGWQVFVAAKSIDPAVRGLAHEALEVDLQDRDGLVAVAQDLRRRHGLHGVFTAGTDFSTAVAWVAEKLRLPGIPYAVAQNATDKGRMRARFRAKAVPCPRYYTVERGPEGQGGEEGSPEKRPSEERPPEGFSFPLVVKPVDNMGARGVRRVDREEDYAAALEAASGQSRSRRVIVEEYLEGPELSLDAVVFRGQATVCGVADRHIYFPPYFVEMGHTMPSDLDPELLRQAEEVFLAGIRALGIRNGAAKGDIKLTPAGPAVGEIAARLSGGYMSGWTFPLSCGVEVTEAALNIAVGLPPGDLTPRFAAVSAERAFISIPGRIRALEGLAEVRQVDGLQELFLRVRVGDRVRLPANNLEKCGNVITRAATRARAVGAADRARQQVFLRLEPNDEETLAFLRDRRPGPWAAFAQLGQALAGTIEGLPDAVGQLGSARLGADGLALLRPEGLQAEQACDWHGLSLSGALEHVERLSGVPSAEAPMPGRLTLGRVFWDALARGGVQAGVFLIESLCRGDPGQVLAGWRPEAGA
jgi:biotin carboxylase